MDEGDKHSPSEFYYPEDLETFDRETETGITECHIINNSPTELASFNLVIDSFSFAFRGLHILLNITQTKSYNHQNSTIYFQIFQNVAF